MNLLLASPLTGAVSGVEYVTWATIEALKDVWTVVHLDTATARRNIERGIPTPNGLVRMAHMTARMATLCKTKPDLAMIQCARNRLGFLKFAVLRAVARQANIPVVAKLGGNDFDLFYEWVSPVFQSLIHRTLRDTSVLVEAYCLRNQFADLVPPDRILWAYLGVPKRPYPHFMRWTQTTNRLLFVGHVSQAKGAVDLLEAMSILQRTAPHLRLTMLGEHIRVERSIVHIADPHGAWKRVKALPDTVTAPGVVQAGKWKEYESADLFVFPSRSEGMPVVILEALMAGLPIVCTPVGALPEILGPNNADVVPVNDPVRLAEAIKALHADTGRRRSMGITNARLAREQFTLGHYRTDLLSALEGVR